MSARSHVWPPARVMPPSLRSDVTVKLPTPKDADNAALGGSAGHPRYQKIRDLNSGGFGFVQLCRDLATGGQVCRVHVMEFVQLRS